MVEEDVEGVELPVEIDVEGVELLVKEERLGGGGGGWGVEGVELLVEIDVEDIELPVEEGIDSSSSIFSFILFMYVSYDFLPRSCILGSFVTFCDVLSMFILRYTLKK